MCVWFVFVFSFFSFVHCKPLWVRSAGLLVKRAARLGTLVGNCSMKQSLLDVGM